MIKFSDVVGPNQTSDLQKKTFQITRVILRPLLQVVKSPIKITEVIRNCSEKYNPMRWRWSLLL